MEIKNYFAIIARRKWVVSGAAALLLVVVAIVASIMPPQYSATAQLRVNTPPGGSSNYVDFNILYADRLMNTYAELAKSTIILDELKMRLKLAKVPTVTVNVIPSSELITITAQSVDPQLSAQIANTMATILIERNVSAASTNSAVTFLRQRLSQIEGELVPVAAEMQKLTDPTATNKARIDVLNLTIAQLGQIYVGLRTNYEDNLIQKSDPALLSDLANQMTRLDQEIQRNKSDLESLASKLAIDNQRMEVLRTEFNQKEQERYSVQTMLDQTMITEMIKENTNVVPSVDLATPPDTKSGASRMLVFAIGTLLSLSAAVVLGFVVELFDDRLLTTDSIRELTQLGLIGKIPAFHFHSANPLRDHETRMVFDESIRRLRVNVEQVISAKSMRSIIFCSASPQEGKSTLISSLAREIASSGQKVILVDADMRIPTIQEHFNLPNETGLSSYLAAEKGLSEIISRTNLENLRVITSGPVLDDPADRVNIAQFQKLFSELEQDYDLVLVDAPSFLSLSEVKELVAIIDGVVVIVARGIARSGNVKEMMEELEEFEPKIVGMVINRTESNDSVRYYHRRKPSLLARISWLGSKISSR